MLNVSLHSFMLAKELWFRPVSLVGLTAMGSASSVFPDRVTQATLKKKGNQNCNNRILHIYSSIFLLLVSSLYDYLIHALSVKSTRLFGQLGLTVLTC